MSKHAAHQPGLLAHCSSPIAHRPSPNSPPTYNGSVNSSPRTGEFALIQRLASVLGADAPPDLVAGIGEDAAAWRLGGEVLLATTDTMVAGVHFLPGRVPWPDVGWKALAANLSDIAAMGGTPLFALVTLGLPVDQQEDDIEALYAGLAECARCYGVTVAGGDIVRAGETFVSIALLGRAELRDGEPLLLRRDGAREGDLIAVTGTLGDSAAGLQRVREGAPAADALVQRHLRPQPRLAAGIAAVRAGIRCGIDVSDGLLQDTGHICEMSGLGAELDADALPLCAALRQAYPDDALRHAASGGEDYELVLIGPRGSLEAIRTDVPLTVIGRMVAGAPRARLLDGDGRERAFEKAGFDQLRDA